MVDLGLDRIFGRTPSTSAMSGTSTCPGTSTRPGTSHRTETTGATATGTIAGSRAPSDTPTTTPTAAPAGARTSTDTGSDGSPRVNVEIQLVMTPDTLFARSSEPAHLPGYGPIPAAIARTLVRDADQAWIRRLFTTPNTRDLVALDSTRRFFNGGLRRLLVLRDQTCRTPWCEAPITAADHTHPAHHGGTTTAANGTGLCQRCNNTKETPGWHTDVISTGLPRNDLHDTMDTGDVPVQTQNDHKSTATLAQTDHQPHTTRITTPTGKTYHSIAPPILGWGASDTLLIAEKSSEKPAATTGQVTTGPESDPIVTARERVTADGDEGGDAPHIGTTRAAGRFAATESPPDKNPPAPRGQARFDVAEELSALERHFAELLAA